MIIKKILVYLIGVLLGISLIYNGIHYFTIKDLHSTISKLNINISKLELNLNTSNKIIDQQNAEITKAANSAKKFQEQLNSIKSELNQQTSVNEKLIKKLKSQPVPKTCKDAVEYFNENSGIFSW